MKRVLLNILVACLPVVGASAYDFWRSGIYFDIISDVEGTVKVTNQSDLDNQVAYTGDVVIPETVYNEGITWRVISISENAFRQCKYMTSLTIPKTITSIGQGTCEGCTSLKTVTLNNNTLVSIDRQSTSLASFFGTQVEKYVLGDVVQKIGKLAFSGCTQLGEVYIPESVTSIYSDAFYGCENLKTVTLLNKEWVSNDRNYNNSLCHYFGKQVEEYVLNDELTAIGNYAFYDCNGLKRITIPQNVESVGNYAFSTSVRDNSFRIA